MDNNFNNGGAEGVNPEASQPMQPDMSQMVQPMGMPQPDGSQPVQPMGMPQPDGTQQMQPDTSQPVQPMGMPQLDGTQPMQPDMSQQAQQVQPDMSQMVMSMDYQQPMMNQQPVQGNGGKPPKKQKPPKVKKPMTGGKLAGIISGGVALVAAIVCGVIFIPKIFKSPKDVVVDAFEATFDSPAENTYFNDVVDAEGIMDKIKQNGGSCSINYTTATNGITAGFNMNSAINPKDKLVQYSLSLLLGNDELIKLNAYGNETNTYLELENIIDGYFMLPNDDPMGAIINSFLGEYLTDYMGDDLSMVTGTSIDYFAAFNDSSEPTGIYSGYVSAFETLWDSAVYEKQGSAKIEVNGEVVKAKEYTVTLKEADIEKALNSLFDGVKQMYADNAEALGMNQATFDATMMQLQSMIPSLINGDFVAKVFIKNGKVVKITAENTISLNGVSLAYDFFFDIDDNNISSELTFNVMGQKAGISFEVKDRKGNTKGNLTVNAVTESIVVNYDSIKADTDSSEEVSYTMDILVNGVNYGNVQGVYTINKQDNSFTASGTVNASNEIMEYALNGKITDVVKGTSFKYVIDDMSIGYNGQTLLSGNMEVTLDASTPTVATYDSSKPVYEIAQLTSEDDLTDIIVNNQTNIMNWLQSIMQNDIVSQVLGELDASDDTYTDDNDDIFDDEPQDNIIEGDKFNVKILGSLPGLHCTYDGQYIIEYEDDAGDYLLDYSLVDDTTPADLIDIYFYYDETGADAEGAVDELNQTLTLSDGSSVTYSYTKRVSQDLGTSIYAIFVKDIGDGVCLYVEAYVYEDVTSAELAEALSDSNFSIVQ